VFLAIFQRLSAKKYMPHITCDNGNDSNDCADDVLKIVVVTVVRSLQFPYTQDVFHTKQYIITKKKLVD